MHAGLYVAGAQRRQVVHAVSTAQNARVGASRRRHARDVRVNDGIIRANCTASVKNSARVKMKYLFTHHNDVVDGGSGCVRCHRGV